MIFSFDKSFLNISLITNLYVLLYIIIYIMSNYFLYLSLKSKYNFKFHICFLLLLLFTQTKRSFTLYEHHKLNHYISISPAIVLLALSKFFSLYRVFVGGVFWDKNFLFLRKCIVLEYTESK
jgi:hypothetical protein